MVYLKLDLFYFNCIGLNQLLMMISVHRPAAQQFSCTESGCTEVFSASISLTKHKTKVHGIDRLKVNICEDCGKRFPSRSALTVHRRMHTDERPFKCDLCPKAYRASSSLVLHRKSHGNKKPFVCEYCGV